MLAYMIIKQSLFGGASNRILHEFKDLYAYSTQSAIMCSNIYYMELVDENPDSSDTMRYVSELLLNKVALEQPDGYLVLVGDGKTYQHLMHGN